MPQIPTLPLPGDVQQIVDFCVEFCTLAGFLAVQAQFEGTGLEPGQAYEATEQLHFQLFKRRRYADREVFYAARAQHLRKK